MKHSISTGGLCKTVDPYSEQAPLFVKTFHEQQYTLTIRPFCVSTDMEAVYAWIGQQTGVGFHKDDMLRTEFMQSFVDILRSEHSQSLLCLLDGLPICELDIGKASLNEVFMYMAPGEEDYAFHFIMSTYSAMRSVYVDVIKAFQEYFFSFGSVRRVLTYLSVNDEWGNHLLTNAGFSYLDTRKILYGAVNLYECVCFS